MNSKRLPVLPLLLGLVALGFWSFFPGSDEGGSWGWTGDSKALLAADGGALTPGGETLGADSDGKPASSRQPVELEPLPPPVEDAAPAEPVVKHDTRLTGTVRRAGGAPLGGASVLLRKSLPWYTPPANAETMLSMGKPNPAILATCDDNGTFVLYDVPAGKYSLAITAERFAPLGRHGIQVPVHEDYDLGAFQLELGIRLEGRVTDPKGQGIEGVQVLSAITRDAGHTRLELPGLGVPLCKTDLDGEFAVTGLAPGTWHLLFDAPGYRVAELKGKTEPAGQSDRSLRLALDTGQFIRGKVTGLDPVADGPLRVSARCAEEQATTAADAVKDSEKRRARHGAVQEDGTFEVGGLVPGVKYRLRLFRLKEVDPDELIEGREPPEQWGTVKGVDHLEEIPGLAEIEFKYHEEASVLLTALDESTGKALTKFRVYVSGSKLTGAGHLRGDDGEIRTNFANGKAHFEGLRPPELGTSVTVRVSADGYADFVKKDRMLRPGEELLIEDVKLSPAPMGKVLVVDKETGEPIPLARVAYTKAVDSAQISRALKVDGDLPASTDKMRFATCDEKGVARLTLWEDQLCAARCVAVGYQKGEQKTLAPPYEEVVKLELVRGGQITVNVTDDLGLPVAGMYVQHAIDDKTQRNNYYWNPDSGLENKTGEDGKVEFLNLPMGKHSFQVLETQGTYGRGGEGAGFEAKGDIFLEEGETSQLDLRVSARGGLNVTVMQLGVPLEGALVKISPLDAKAGRNNYWFGAQKEDPRTQVSDYAGRAEFRGIKVGEYLLRVAHGERRMVVRREVRVTREPSEIEFELGLITIEGRVTDPEGQPIQYVSMTVRAVEDSKDDRDMNDYRISISEDEDGDAEYNFESIKTWNIRTDEDGRYELSGVAPETDLRVSAYYRYVVGESRKLGPLGAQEYVGSYDFVLSRAGAVGLKLANVSRSNRDSYKFLLTRMEGEKEIETKTLTMRRWRSSMQIESLHPGRWRVRLHHKDVVDPIQERELEVRVGETTRMTFSP